MAITKPAGSWIYEDLFSLPDDGRRYEIIEGELCEMPSPTSAHGVTIRNLMFLLGPVIEMLRGWLLTAPLDVFSRALTQSNQILSSCCRTAMPAW